MKKNAPWIVGLLLAVSLCLVAKYALEIRLYDAFARKPNLPPGQARYHSDSLKQYNLGFENLIAALFWVQLLQQSTYEKVAEGRVSWEFSQLDAITALDRDFQRAYSYGAIFLSVFKQDKLGARLMLEKWAKYNPHYWRVHYLLGYHLYYELGDFQAGSREILKAASMEGSPTWLSSLGIRLLSQTGALAQALKLSLEIYPGVTDEEGRQRLRLRIRAINFSLQKAAWDHALSGYQRKNHSEPSNLEALYPFVGLELRSVSSIIAGEEVDTQLAKLLKENFGFYFDAKKKKIMAVNDHDNLLLEKTGIYVHDDDKE